MLKRAAGDALPGFGATEIADGNAKVDAYETADNAQLQKKQALGAAHAAFKAVVADIKADTRDIKLGANRAFPHTDPVNAFIRRDLGLLENRNWLG